jgi:DNA-binding NtrC family response regulator
MKQQTMLKNSCLRAEPVIRRWRRMATTCKQFAEKTLPAMTVVVVDRDESIRTALGDLLEDEGYAVVEAESLFEAEAIIDAAPEPMVLVVGDAEMADRPGLRFFMAVAANPVTQHAYVYLLNTPQQNKLPSLLRARSDVETSMVDRPYELAFLLTVVSAAAERLRP